MVSPRDGYMGRNLLFLVDFLGLWMFMVQLLELFLLFYGDHVICFIPFLYVFDTPFGVTCCNLFFRKTIDERQSLRL